MNMRKKTQRFAVLDNAPKGLIDEYFTEFIHKLNVFYLAQDILHKNSLLLATMKTCCLSVIPDSQDNQALTAIDVQVKGVFASEAQEINDLRDEFMNYAFENFRLLLAYELMGFTSNATLRRRTVVNLIQTYMINARVQRSPYLLQEALSAQEFASLVEQMRNKVLTLDLGKWQNQLRTDYAFAYTHAVIAYAYQESKKLRFAELEELIDQVYQYLMRYSFLNRWLGLQIYLTGYVNHYYPDIYLDAPLWYLDIKEAELRDQSLEALVNFVREQVNTDASLQELLQQYANAWLDRDYEQMDFVYFMACLGKLDLSHLAQYPFPNLLPGLADYSKILIDVYHANCCNFLGSLNSWALNNSGYQYLEHIEQGLSKLEAHYQKHLKLDHKDYLEQKISQAHKAYARSTLKTYAKVARNLALTPDPCPRSRLKRWWKQLLHKIRTSV